jgi:flagellar protein FlaJ
MFEDLKKNLEQEKRIVADMKAIAIGFESASGNKSFYKSSLMALAQELDMLNNAVPALLSEWMPMSEVGRGTSVNSEEEVKKLESFSSPSLVKKREVPAVLQKKETMGVSYVSPSTKEKRFVTINKKDKAEFLKKLKFSEESFAGVKKMEADANVYLAIKSNPYISFSSRYFRKFSDKISHQFDDLSKDLKSANIPILLSSYLSMAMMSSVIAFAFGLFVFGLMMILSLSNWIYFVLPFGFMGLTLAGFYLYPSSEAGTVHKNISYELPFSTIHMSAIAGSNITPVKIFKIIADSVEYPNVGAEMRKVVTQIEVYGYDMVTSLKNVAKTTKNRKLSELFSGLATNIASGGALKNYLEKKSESFLVDYRLERQKYSALAGTFMDVYISILIAAPLVLMMMLIVMNVAGLGMGGLGIMTLMGLAIGAIVITNIIFIVVLNIKQPRV